VSNGHRGQLVDLAVKGQLAPAEDHHHQHIDLVVAVRLDAIALVEADQVGLQVLPVEPPQRPWMVPARREAGQVDRRDGVRHAAIFPSHIIVSRARETGPGTDSLLGSRLRSRERSGTARDPKHDLAGTD
jgi:hypothetical protein